MPKFRLSCIVVGHNLVPNIFFFCKVIKHTFLWWPELKNVSNDSPTFFLLLPILVFELFPFGKHLSSAQQHGDEPQKKYGKARIARRAVFVFTARAHTEIHTLIFWICKTCDSMFGKQDLCKRSRQSFPECSYCPSSIIISSHFWKISEQYKQHNSRRSTSSQQRQAERTKVFRLSMAWFAPKSS